MISPLPGVTATKPGSAMRPLPGIAADVVDNEGDAGPNGGGGYLVLTEPWPVDAARHLGRPAALHRHLLGPFADQGYYFAGDGAKKDEDGDLWLLGRVDDVMLVSGHNISTTEVESALVSHPAVAEAAVVGANDATTGQAHRRLRHPARRQRGATPSWPRPCATTSARRSARSPSHARSSWSPNCPKTRSGKIMRRLLRDVAEDRAIGDTTTLADSTVMELISAKLPHAEEE